MYIFERKYNTKFKNTAVSGTIDIHKKKWISVDRH